MADTFRADVTSKRSMRREMDDLAAICRLGGLDLENAADRARDAGEDISTEAEMLMHAVHVFRQEFEKGVAKLTASALSACYLREDCNPEVMREFLDEEWEAAKPNYDVHPAHDTTEAKRARLVQFASRANIPWSPP